MFSSLLVLSSRRSSEKAIALALLIFLTLGPYLDPECNFPSLYSSITFLNFACPGFFLEDIFLHTVQIILFTFFNSWF